MSGFAKQEKETKRIPTTPNGRQATYTTSVEGRLPSGNTTRRSRVDSWPSGPAFGSNTRSLIISRRPHTNTHLIWNRKDRQVVSVKNPPTTWHAIPRCVVVWVGASPLQLDPTVFGQSLRLRSTARRLRLTQLSTFDHPSFVT